MQKETLYQISSTGGTKQWSIEVRQNADGTATIINEWGLQGGKLQTKETPIKAGKNAGKANATTAYTQAVADAKSDIAKKIGKGYKADINAITHPSVKGSGAPAPMLAQKYDPTMKQKGSKDLKKLGIEGKEVMVQNKLDGNRCLAHVTLAGARLYTREGKDFAPMPHVTKALVEIFTKIYDYVNKKYGVTEYWVDGEMFCKDYSFNTINGILKKQTLTADDQKVVDSLEYHVYDVILDAPYETRYKVTQYFNHGPIKRVLAEVMIAEEKALEAKFLEMTADGHEGMMIRQMGIPYENKRSWQLLKYKAWEDDEFPIVGFEESRSGDTLGAFWFEMTNGIRFKAAPEGFTHADQKSIWDNQSKYLGKKMTVRYFGFSPAAEGGRPRFPKVKGQRADLL